jgi:phage/conjugal plasmid C-4 type zinc finger TraR family protein
MYDGGERAIEAAEAAVNLETSQAIAGISAALSAPGSDDCADCGEPIPAQRRAALPSARRCVDRQSSFEREARGQ